MKGLIDRIKNGFKGLIDRIKNRGKKPEVEGDEVLQSMGQRDEFDDYDDMDTDILVDDSIDLDEKPKGPGILQKLKTFKLDVRVLLIGGLILLNIILLFKPGIFNLKNSYSSVRGKNKELKELNRNIEEEVNAHSENTQQLGNLIEEDAEIEKRAMVSRKKIDPNGLEFHLPSILIRLEDSSKRNNLSLSVKYSEIAYQNIQGEDIENVENKEEAEGEEEEAEEVEDTEEDVEEVDENVSFNIFNFFSQKVYAETFKEIFDEKVEDQNFEEGEEAEGEEDEAEKVEDTEESEEGEEDEEAGEAGIQDTIETYKDMGVEVTSIPIEVKGTYEGVKNFITDLDKLNYIEPAKVEIVSKGASVEARIIINIYHGDIFD